MKRILSIIFLILVIAFFLRPSMGEETDNEITGFTNTMREGDIRVESVYLTGGTEYKLSASGCPKVDTIRI